MKRKVRLGTFSPSVLVEVAASTGALATAGLDIEEVPATSSPSQFTELLAGGLDAVLTNPDNVLAYRCVPGNPLGRTADVRILAAIDRGLGLSLFAEPGYAEPDDLRGKVLGVDVAGSGFAFVAFALLNRLGLEAGQDCEIQALGSTPRRAEALLSGQCACTVLNAGNDLFAEANGAHRLANASSLGPYVGAVLAATGEALEKEHEMLAELTKVLVTTAADLVAGKHADAVLAATLNRLALDDESALRYVATLLDHTEGLVPDGRLPPEALDTVISLRNRRSPAGRLTLERVLESGLIDESLLPQ